MADPRDEDSEEDGDYDPGAEAAPEEEEERPARKKPRRSRFVDDEAGVDDDDDDDDATAAGGGRAAGKKAARAAKAARAGRSRFIDDEVEVEDEDDDDDDDDDDEDDELVPDDDEEVLDNDKIRRQNEELRRKQREEDIAKLEAEVNERYTNNPQRARYPAEEASRGPRDEIRRHAELPGMSDPKLFLLRCKPGHEHEIVIFMMAKFVNHAGTAEPLQITACVATAIRGYVYVEAFKEAHVRAAVYQIRNVFQSTLKLVPLSEMTEVLRMPSKAERSDARLVVGSWVRLKRPAEYKGDLAAVVSVDDVQATGEVVVRCIPRLDYTLLARDPNEGGARRKSTARPAARLFSVAEAQNAGFEPYAVERGAKHTAYALERPREYGNLRFEDGFLIKSLKMNYVTLDASPTADEVEVFRAMLASVGKEAESAALLQGMERAVRSATQSTFAPGDTVRVVEGDLLNLTCTVVRVHADGNLSCTPHHEGLAQEVELKASQVAKHFRMGDHCQVLRGQFAGETGLIVALSLESVTLFSDLSKRELSVRPADLTEAAEVSAGRETLGAFALHDLVALDQSSVGVVVKVEHSSFKVLSTSGTLRTVPLAEMGRKRSSRGAVALDADSNLISEGDVLQLTDAADGRQGVVKHLFKSFLFLHSREQPEHAGIFVARARQTRLVDGKGGGGGGKAAAYQGQSYGVATGEGGALPYGGGAAGGAGGRGWGQDGGRGGGGRGFGGGRGGRADELQNAHVRIQAGPYKGMYGTVKSATDGVARVELSAKSKVVTLGKDKLLIVQRAGEAADGARQMGGGGGMGGLGGGLGGGFGMGGGGGLGLPTPLRDDGFRTPMRDGGLYPSTPMRDAMPMTPMRDGELGGGEGARASDPWDPTKTPAHDPWANVGARTPSHSAAWGMGGASESAGGGGGGGVHHDEYAGLGLAPHWPPRAGEGLGGRSLSMGAGGSSSTAGAAQPAAWQQAQQPQTQWAHGGGGRAPPPPPPSGAPPPPPPAGGPPGGGFGAFGLGGGGAGGGGGALPADDSASALAPLPCEIAVQVVGGAHAGSTGHIAQVRGARGDAYAVVIVGADGVRVVECSRRELEPTTPGKKDAIVILHGDLVHSTGVLIGVDGTDGIIKMDTTNDIKIVELRSCAKLVRVGAS